MIDRPLSLNVGGTSLALPCFFPSISSVKTHLPPLEYLRVLSAAQHPAFLISAYDIHHASLTDRQEIGNILQESRQKGRIVLLDSGNYESYWKNDGAWSKDALDIILREKSFDLAFHFDNQSPAPGIEAIVKDIESEVTREQAISQSATIVPIVHAAEVLLPEVVRQVVCRLRPLMVAVPERALGDGIFRRAATVQSIREALSKVEYYCPLHLLGTGNPLSIALYAACGADCFDGLEWCQTVVDHDSGRLFHFQQYDLFQHQTPMGQLDGIPYAQLALTHNLIFYNKWIEQIRRKIAGGQLSALIAQHVPQEKAAALRGLGL